jgi:cobalt/nickel transport protein
LFPSDYTLCNIKEGIPLRNKQIVLLTIIGLIGLLAFFNSFLASPHPDGLERVAEDHGFIEHAKDSFSIFGDYALPFGNKLISTGLAGIFGVLLTYLLLHGLGKILTTKKVASK